MQGVQASIFLLTYRGEHILLTILTDFEHLANNAYTIVDHVLFLFRALLSFFSYKISNVRENTVK